VYPRFELGATRTQIQSISTRAPHSMQLLLNYTNQSYRTIWSSKSTLNICLQLIERWWLAKEPTISSYFKLITRSHVVISTTLNKIYSWCCVDK